MCSKTRFSLDGKNRLVIRRKRKKMVADGFLALDKKNQLLYYLNEPVAWRRQQKLGRRIIFRGNWCLSASHEPEFVLSQTRAQKQGEVLRIRADILAAEKDALAYEVKTEDKFGRQHVRILKFFGRWQADEHNRLNFLLERKTEPDAFIFRNAWQLDDNFQIVYRYERTALKRKTRIEKSFAFQGSWQICNAHKLAYSVARSSVSRFEFRVQLESPSILPEEGAIKYRIGIGVRKERREKVLVLSGLWKFSRKLGFDFEIDYGEGRIGRMRFGALMHFDKANNLYCSLLSQENSPLGLELKFSHTFLRLHHAQAFLRLLKKRGDPRLEGGLTIPF